MQFLFRQFTGIFATGITIRNPVKLLNIRNIVQKRTSFANKKVFDVMCSRPLSHLVDLKMEESQNVVVRCIDGKETMNISFHFKGKDYNFLRSQTETLDKTFVRMSQNFKKLADKANKRRAKKLKKGTQPPEEFNPLVSIPECSIFHDGDKLVPLESCNHDAWINGAILRIGDIATYNVTVNIPTIVKLKLPSHFIAGCPLFPYIETEFTQDECCQFSWFVEVDGNSNSPINQSEETKKIGGERNWIVISDERTFTPSLREVGKHLLLRCKPGNGEKQGIPVEVISTSKVVTGPDKIPFQQRHKETTERCTGAIFRVVCYNLLADLYANSDFSRDFLFPHCPAEFLVGDYRQQLLLKEISGYNGDIICLQEVDKTYFERSLSPALSSIGLEGTFCSKSGGTSEGEALFFRRDRYELLGQHDIVLGDRLKEDPDNADLLNSLSRSQSFLENILSRTTIAQVAMLHDKWNPGKKLIVANTHLYFRPNANHVRMVQTLLILHHIQQLIKIYQHKDSGGTVSVLFLGDLNSSPKSGAYQLISSGHVPANSVHWYTGGKEEFCGGIQLSHQLKLKSVCPDIPYTNYVPAFMETIDHVTYSHDTIGVERVVPMPSHEEVTRLSALPNEVFPSDHLPLVCDLKWL
ncbi:2',5'-phosphodiesterase 12-like [Apostichopus japonicus]|uniref:2',5'-phosphodiesterase 12-like n=1 Tax=Stichopus japonicus TaxID=307972 RepID=UPI003AB739FB